MEIHDALKRFRAERGLTQKAVADSLGIAIQAYQKYEYGKITPSAEIIKSLSSRYGVSADYLLGRSDKP